MFNRKLKDRVEELENRVESLLLRIIESESGIVNGKLNISSGKVTVGHRDPETYSEAFTASSIFNGGKVPINITIQNALKNITDHLGLEFNSIPEEEAKTVLIKKSIDKTTESEKQ